MSTPITVAYGDGIGPEIMEAVLSILHEAEAKISIDIIEIGERVYSKEWSHGISPSGWESIERTKILLKSPTTTPQGKGHKSLNVALRKNLGLYANIRPCISYHPVIENKFDKFDIVVIRENEEDVYTGIEHRLTGDSYQCTKIITRSGSEKICRYAFEYAKKHNRKKVTCLTKDNIMKMTDGTFHAAFDHIAKEYPDIKAEHYIVDIGMARVATEPENFDVIVTENLYGDILSDIVAQTSGSVGLAGSSNIGNEYAMFEAVHGSAPDIAGKNIANPSGLLNAAVHMLIYIGQVGTAKLIYDAWLKTLEDGIHTADLYKEKKSKQKVGTKEFAGAIIENLGKKPAILSELTVGSSTNSKISEIQNSYEQDYKVRKLVGSDITLAWSKPADFDQIVKLFETSNPQIIAIYSKGLAIWPGGSKSSSDQITCRFIANNKITNSDVNNLLIKFEEHNFDVEFLNNANLFKVLEIKAGQVVGKGYEELSAILKKHHKELILVNHPDKGGDKNRFDQIYKAYQELKKYIEPLESGNPCVKVSVGAESDGRLTAREFHYRKNLFNKLKVSEEEAVAGLYNYVTPLEEKRSLIEEDKKTLALKFIERKNVLLFVQKISVLPLALLTTITIGCYFSWWIIALNIIINNASRLLTGHYMKKYANSEISTDEFMSKINYIVLGSKLLINYPLAAFSVYLLTTNFIANGLTVGGAILGSLLLLAVLIEMLAPVFSKSCEIYAEKHTKDLLEEDPRDRVQKETDLLGWYDLRKLLMPIIMPLVRKCFAEVASEFAERNFDEVKTDMSDVNTEGLSNPQAIEFAQQTV
ncbi:isocitrate dehydrogenase [Trichonephila clavata]|uniref:Isocitrate dehydrogenase [NADP] n=1 Tax=Trichonephila clavata TaxID=2740835 RepID=A0A8X6F9B0_TRICU|nr:isocitrate dehydrogenase [Trichonephila clavata]